MALNDILDICLTHNYLSDNVAPIEWNYKHGWFCGTRKNRLASVKWF